jgi:hypothetical protein
MTSVVFFFLGDSQDVFFIDFLIEQRTMNADYYLKMANEAARVMMSIYRSVGIMCRKIGITF